MLSDRLQRQLDRLLDEAEAAVDRADWDTALDRAAKALVIDPVSVDALAYQAVAMRGLGSAAAGVVGGKLEPGASPTDAPGNTFTSGHARTSEPEPATPPIPHDPSALYRRTFVGREAELRQLQAAFAAAAAGRGGLVMVVGEPGIGKTSLTEQLAAHVVASAPSWFETAPNKVLDPERSRAWCNH